MSGHPHNNLSFCPREAEVQGAQEVPTPSRGVGQAERGGCCVLGPETLGTAAQVLHPTQAPIWGAE